MAMDEDNFVRTNRLIDEGGAHPQLSHSRWREISGWQPQIAFRLQLTKDILIMAFSLERHDDTHTIGYKSSPIFAVDKTTDHEVGCNHIRIGRQLWDMSAAEV